jgi:ABC-2 type transport system permease protein
MNALKIACFEIRLVLTDRWSVFWLLVLPFILIFFIAKAFPQQADPSMLQSYLGVCNQDSGFLAQALVEDLTETGFNVHPLKTIEERKEGQWHRTLIIPPNFTAKTLEGRKVVLRLEIEPGSYQPALHAVRVKIFKSVGRIIGNLCVMATLNQNSEGKDATSMYQRSAALEPRVTLDSSFIGQGKVIPWGYNLTVPGTIVMSIIFSVMTYGTALFAQDRRTGLLRRLATTPCLNSEILLGKLLGRLFMGFLQIIILLSVSALVFDVYLGHSPLGWILCLVPYTFACGALGLLMGCFFRNEDQASILGWIPAILMAALGGCWWPKEIAPNYLNTIGYLFPPAWAVDGLQQLISLGRGPGSVLVHAAVLWGFFILFMGLCVRFVRYD